MLPVYAPLPGSPVAQQFDVAAIFGCVALATSCNVWLQMQIKSHTYTMLTT